MQKKKKRRRKKKEKKKEKKRKAFNGFHVHLSHLFFSGHTVITLQLYVLTFSWGWGRVGDSKRVLLCTIIRREIFVIYLFSAPVSLVGLKIVCCVNFMLFILTQLL